MNHILRKLAVLAASMGVAASLCAASAVSASPAASVDFTFNSGGVNGYSAAKIYTGTGSKVRLTPGWSWSGYESDTLRLRLSVQRDTGSGWKTVSTASPLATGGIDILAPTFKTSAKSQAVKYRLFSAAYEDATGRVEADAYSPAVTVVYENQQKYTGYAKEMYGYMKQYCSQVAVHSVSSIDGNPGLAGQAAGSSQFIKVRSSERVKPVAYRKAIALHECAHVRQWLNYGASPAGDELAAKQEAKYFTNDSAPKALRNNNPYGAKIPAASFAPAEHAADCSSMALNPKGYLGYGGYCKASELKRGKALMLGKHYDLTAGSKA